MQQWQDLSTWGDISHSGRCSYWALLTMLRGSAQAGEISPQGSFLFIDDHNVSRESHGWPFTQPNRTAYNPAAHHRAAHNPVAQRCAAGLCVSPVRLPSIQTYRPAHNPSAYIPPSHVVVCSSVVCSVVCCQVVCRWVNPLRAIFSERT